MQLVLWLIVAANCHFIDGSSVGERVGRAATEPLVSFNKLTEAENKERLEKCGKPEEVLSETQNRSIPNHPWIARMSDNTEGSEFGQLVVISKRHMLADGHSIRKWNLTRIFGDYSDKPAQVLSSSNVEEIPETIWVRYCLELSSDVTCYEIRLVVKPSKIMIDNFRKPRIVLLEFEIDIQKVPVCLPGREMEKGDDIFLYGRLETWYRAEIYKVHTNGWSVLKVGDLPNGSLAFGDNNLKKRTIYGNTDQDTRVGNSTYQLFSSVFQHTDLICEWTGVCPPLPRVHFNRLSKEQNEERLRTCGRRVDAPRLSDAIKLFLDAPWLAIVTRSDEFRVEGHIISQRHIIADPGYADIFVYERRNLERKNPSIIGTSVPVKIEHGQYYNYNVTIRKCVDATCQSRKNVTLHPKKMMFIPGGAVIFEMGEDLGVIPVCLPTDFYTEIEGAVRAVSRHGSFISYRMDKNNEKEGTVLKTEETKQLPAFASEEFPRTLVHQRNIVFTVYRMDNDFDGEYTEKRSFRYWEAEHEYICKATGICSRKMVPLRLKKHETRKLWHVDNEERLRTCGTLFSNTSQLVVGANDAPWLVGIRINRHSPITHTGVLISPRHVLVPGSMFEREEDLSEMFGTDFKNQQPRQMSAVLPEYEIPEFKFNFEVILNRCNDAKCSIKTETVIKPSRLLAYDSSDPSLFVLEFDDYLPDVPICLEDTKEVEDGDEVFIQQYADPEAKVLSVADASIQMRIEPFVRKSGILVKEENNHTVLVGKGNNRHVLVGNCPSTGFASSSGSFASMFSLRFKICELTGVCPPFFLPIQLQKISEQEDKRRSETCGKHNPLHHHSTSPEESAIARNSPWLVGIHGPRTQVHTGVVISRRHVLMDDDLFNKDMDYYEVLGGCSTFNQVSSLPMPRTNIELRVKVSVCEDDECRIAVEKELIPTKLSQSNNSSWMILEFDEDVPVTPICLPDSIDLVSDNKYVQDYTKPKEVIDANVIIGHAAYTRLMVKEVNGRFAIVGTRQEYICQVSGVCAITSRHTREVPKKFKNQDPQLSGATSLGAKGEP